MLAAILRAMAEAIRTEIDAEILKVIAIFSGAGLLLALTMAIMTGPYVRLGVS